MTVDDDPRISSKEHLAMSGLQTTPSTAPEVVPGQHYNEYYHQPSIEDSGKMAYIELSPAAQTGWRRRPRIWWILGAVALVAVIAIGVGIGLSVNKHGDSASSEIDSAKQSNSSDAQSDHSTPTSTKTKLAEVIGLAAVFAGNKNKTSMFHRSRGGKFRRIDCNLVTKPATNGIKNSCKTSTMAWIKDAKVNTPLMALGTTDNATLLYFSTNNSIRATKPDTKKTFTVASDLEIHNSSKLTAVSPPNDPTASSFYAYYQAKDRSIKELSSNTSSVTRVVHPEAAAGTWMSANTWWEDMEFTRAGYSMFMIVEYMASEDSKGFHWQQRYRTEPDQGFGDGDPDQLKVAAANTSLACRGMSNRRNNDTESTIDNRSTSCYYAADDRTPFTVRNGDSAWDQTGKRIAGSLQVGNPVGPMVAAEWFVNDDLETNGPRVSQLFFQGKDEGMLEQKVSYPDSGWGDGPGIPVE